MARRGPVFEYVRRAYGVPAGRGRRVRIRYSASEIREGSITSATHYIYVRLDGEKRPKPFHPTWEVQYLDADGNVICDHWKALEEAR